MAYVKCIRNLISSTVPDGKTVTPTDDISIWLACGARSETYTTLSQVLADVACLSALINDNNAVDYLVRSKSFAGNTEQSLVPSMTGYTTPSGVVSASSENSSYPAWKAFDGNDSSFFASTSTAIGTYLQYDFGANNGKKATSIRIKSRNTGGYVIKGSNDGFVSDTHTLYTTHTMVDNEEGEFDLSNVDTYRYYRIELSANPNSATLSLWEVQFYYATSGITTNATAMSYIGLNNYASNTLSADSTWCNAMLQSAYRDSVFNVKNPTMTSNTTPSGIVSASSVYSTPQFDSFKAFDNDPSTTTAFSSSDSERYVQYKFPNNVLIKGVGIIPGRNSTGITMKNFKISASDDGITFDDLYSGVHGDNHNMEYFDLNNNHAYRYYRLYSLTSYVSATYYNVAEIQFYGRVDI